MFYFTRINGLGATLVTAYKTAKTAKGIADKETKSTKKSFWEGDMYLNLETGEFGKSADGVGLLSYIKANGTSNGGRFAVFSKIDEKPNDLGIRFESYSDANVFIKAIVGAYRELWVVELDKIGEAEKPQEDIEVSEEAPF